jgi:hypothetical protein
MLERLVFIVAATTYLTRDCSIDSLEEIAYLDDEGDLCTTIKGVTSPGGIVNIGTGVTAMTSRNNVIPVSIRAVSNLKLCVYYLKHTERVHRKPAVTTIGLELVRSYRNQQRHEVSFKKTAEELVINDKDSHRTLKISRRIWPPNMEEQGLL